MLLASRLAILWGPGARYELSYSFIWFILVHIVLQMFFFPRVIFGSQARVFRAGYGSCVEKYERKNVQNSTHFFSLPWDTLPLSLLNSKSHSEIPSPPPLPKNSISMAKTIYCTHNSGLGKQWEASSCCSLVLGREGFSLAPPFFKRISAESTTKNTFCWGEKMHFLKRSTLKKKNVSHKTRKKIVKV